MFFSQEINEVTTKWVDLLDRVPTLLVITISRTFPVLSRTPETFFQNPVVRRRCLNMKTNNSYYKVRAPVSGTSDFFFHIYK